jgi:hypothetical protein
VGSTGSSASRACWRLLPDEESELLADGSWAGDQPDLD